MNTQPLTALQAQAWRALTFTPAGPVDIASRCGLTPGQVGGLLHALQAKGLAMHTAGGWRMVDETPPFDTKQEPSA